jgi:hypothetical protein
MPSPVAGWLAFRVLRWLFWLAAAAYFVAFWLRREDHLNSFGNLLNSTEFWMFMLPLAALFTGFLELAMRERAALLRPAAFRNWNGLNRAVTPRAP